jgi:hypothetical protein
MGRDEETGFSAEQRNRPAHSSSSTRATVTAPCRASCERSLSQVYPVPDNHSHNPTLDVLVDALVGLGRLASDLEAFVESIDVNPFVALPKGGCALDALIVLRKQ